MTCFSFSLTHNYKKERHFHGHKYLALFFIFVLKYIIHVRHPHSNSMLASMDNVYDECRLNRDERVSCVAVASPL